jgi:modulator of FtsH protease
MIHEWHDFFIAVAGASATLTGLIFVGISLGLQRILSNPHLPNRAMQSLILLMSILMVSLVNLIPSQSLFEIGVEICVVGVAAIILSLRADIKAFPNTPHEFKRYVIQNIIFTQVAVWPSIIGGLAICLVGFSGFYIVALGIIICFVKAVFDAWVLVIEIYR